MNEREQLQHDKHLERLSSSKNLNRENEDQLLSAKFLSS